jgi:hypothetical protein
MTSTPDDPQQARLRSTSFQTHKLFQCEGTSEHAAADAAPRAPSLRQNILMAIVAKPQTPHEVKETLRLKNDISTVRARMSELRCKGLIEPTGATRLTPNGSRAEVMRATTPTDCGPQL